VITFLTDTDIPAPNPQFLTLHAACARVLHTAGLAKEAENLIEDWSETQVLSEGGSSVDLLAHALTMATAFVN
jgi:hypothetical protein